jgi:nucleoside 2-deoxyribosyltransferase
MKIYVAGKWQEKAYIKDVMQRLESYSHTISYDWTKHNDGDDAKYCAQNDLDGVASADIMIAIVQKSFPYKGVYVEIGAALALDKAVYLIGNGIKDCIFSSLCYQLDSLDYFLNGV